MWTIQCPTTEMKSYVTLYYSIHVIVLINISAIIKIIYNIIYYAEHCRPVYRGCEHPAPPKWSKGPQFSPKQSKIRWLTLAIVGPTGIFQCARHRIPWFIFFKWTWGTSSVVQEDLSNPLPYLPVNRGHKICTIALPQPSPPVDHLRNL